MVCILLVADSPNILYTTSQVLEEGSYEVISARDGEQALQLAAARLPDLILLDVLLPVLNGYQVCRRLKAAPETAGIPVIMLTTNVKDADQQWGLEQGAEDHLTRPFESDTLLALVSQYVGGG